MAEDLSESELERYAAQIERIGIDAQARLKAARAIVVGAGPAGSAAAADQVSRGVGYVAVVDGAVVTPGDLCGQALLDTPDVGALDCGDGLPDEAARVDIELVRAEGAGASDGLRAATRAIGLLAAVEAVR